MQKNEKKIIEKYEWNSKMKFDATNIDCYNKIHERIVCASYK